MIRLNGINYYTAKELAVKVGVSKGLICRLCKQGRIRHEFTELGYFIPEVTAITDWNNRKDKQHD